MSRHWQEIVTDPDERKVFEALEDPQWDFRTVEGMVRTTGLSEEAVQNVIEKFSELVRQSKVPDRKGRDLFTLARKGETVGEVVNTLRSIVTKSEF